jgi:hypothetical protein
MEPNVTPEAVQIVREMIKEFTTSARWCANKVESQAVDDEPTELYANSRKYNAERAEALSSLLAVVEAVGNLGMNFTHYYTAENLLRCICCEASDLNDRHELIHRPGCLELVRQALSSVASETREG